MEKKSVSVMDKIKDLEKTTDFLSDSVYETQEKINLATIEPAGTEKRKEIIRETKDAIKKMKQLQNQINEINKKIETDSPEDIEFGKIIRLAKQITRISLENEKTAAALRSFKSLCFFNLKGGVSKTGNSFQVGTTLGREGKKVLFIDLDPQGNLSYFCDITEEKLEYQNVKKMLEYNLPATEVIEETQFKNVDIIACDIQLTEVESYLQNQKTGREFVLKNWISENIDYLNNHYDYIIGDLSPSLGYLNINYFMIADSIVYIVTPTRPAIKGVLSFEKQYYNYIAPYITQEKKFGMFLNMIEDNTKISRDFQIYQKSLEQFEDMMMRTSIHKATSFQKHTEVGKIIEPSSSDKQQQRLFEEYQMLLAELKERGIL